MTQRKNRRKTFFKSFAVCILAVSLVCPAFADELSDARAKADEIEQQLQESRDKVNELKESSLSISESIAQADEQIKAIEAVILDYEKQSENKQKEIDELEKQIAEKEKEIDAEYASMKKRIRFMYENMDNSFWEAFFSAESFADALKKIVYLLELTDYDRKQMEKIEKMKKEIVSKKTTIEKEQAEIQKLQEAQKNQMAVAEDLYAVKAAELETTEGRIAMEEALSTELKAQLQSAQNEIAASVAAYEAQQWAEQEEEYYEDYEEEPSDNPESSVTETPGIFCFPLPADYYGWDWVTSPYGYRINPITGYGGENHSGMDFGAYYGTPIYACDSGIVVWAGWLDSTGNYTVIYHGNGLYTEYMHQCEIVVSYGETVERGQLIGYVGSTGWSTGPHLHLGVIEDYSGSFLSYNRVDPAPYIGMD